MGQVIEQFATFLAGLGISPTEGIVGVTATLVLLKELGVFSFLKAVITRSFSLLQQKFYRQDDEDFVFTRQRFVQQLIYEIERQNREDDWNDFNYVPLEAEIEVDKFTGAETPKNKPLLMFQRLATSIVRMATFSSPYSGRIEKNTISAINNSKSRAFLLIGDPGSGKTVSIRHLALQMAKRAERTKNKNVVVPLYLNLKHFNLRFEESDASTVERWIKDQLTAGQDRTTRQFIDKNFHKMLMDGNFFFLFDSFDELPAVLDSGEEESETQKYAETFDRFLHSPHGCRGIVASRPYRAPKIFIGDRLSLRSLSDQKIKETIFSYLIQDRELARKLVDELFLRRDDLLQIARNPFYLSLLVSYTRSSKGYPQRQFDLFDHFIRVRTAEDADRIDHLGFSPAVLIEASGHLAYAMFNSQVVGLEINVNEISQLLQETFPTGNWTAERTANLIGALKFSKIGKITDGGNDFSSFSFVHRRFHEYFCAVFLQNNREELPISEIVSENRWREVLILLCEILSPEQLTDVFSLADEILTKTVHANPSIKERRDSIEIVKLLKDGFKSRVYILPVQLRKKAEDVLLEQFQSGNLLDKKRAIECAVLSGDEKLPLILDHALNTPSFWIQATAFHASRLLSFMNDSIETKLRIYLYKLYSDFSILRYFKSYWLILSSPPLLKRLQNYLSFLYYFALLQITLVFLLLVYLLFGDPPSETRAALLLFVIIVILGFSYSFANPRKKMIDFKTGFFNNSILYILFYSIFFQIVSFATLSNDYPSFLPPLTFFGFIANWGIHRSINGYPTKFQDWLMLPFRKLMWFIKSAFRVAGNLRATLKSIFAGLVIQNRRVIARKLFFLIVIGLYSWATLSALNLLQERSYSINVVYREYGLWTALGAVLVVLPVLALAAGLILAILALGVLTIFDLFRLANNMISSETDTISYEKAAEELSKFNHDFAKAIYIRGLFRLLLKSGDIAFLTSIATKQKGAVSDELFQLIEKIEDSRNNK